MVWFPNTTPSLGEGVGEKPHIVLLAMGVFNRPLSTQENVRTLCGCCRFLACSDAGLVGGCVPLALWGALCWFWCDGRWLGVA